MPRVIVPHVLIATSALTAGFTLGWFFRPRTIAPQPAPQPRSSEAAAAGAHGRLTAGPAASMPGGLVAAVQAVQRPSDRATRLYAFALRLRDLAPAEYPRLLEALRAMRSPESPEILAMLCSVWAAQDGPAAFAAGRVLATHDGHHVALHAAIRAWARSEPARVEAALRAAGMADLQTDEMAALLQGWAAADPAAAEAFLDPSVPRNSSDEVQAAVQRGFETIAQARIDADPHAAMEWYARLPESLRERSRQSVLAQLSAKDPRLATDWLARDDTTQLGESDLTPLLRQMRLDGFEQQFAWARGAANIVTRESALAAVVRESAPAHLVPLGEWLAARSDDASLVPAFSAYALQVVRKSPNAAVTWALSLDQPELRQGTLNTVALEWSTMNPRAVREWAERTRLVDWDEIAR